MVLRSSVMPAYFKIVYYGSLRKLLKLTQMMGTSICLENLQAMPEEPGQDYLANYEPVREAQHPC